MSTVNKLVLGMVLLLTGLLAGLQSLRLCIVPNWLRFMVKFLPHDFQACFL
jgi:hypothetical protein